MDVLGHKKTLKTLILKGFWDFLGLKIEAENRYVVEVAGIEPASANPPPSALHAYPCH